MVSSAVYRYFPSRDDLITELRLVVCYTELAEEVEAAETEVADPVGPPRPMWRSPAPYAAGP